MKRKIALLIIAVMMISLSSCKRMPEGDVSDAPGAAPETSENAETKETENNADTEKENTVKGDDAEETETKQETPDNDSDEQKTEPEKNDDTESEPAADVNTTEPNEVTEPETEPYLPVELGYVKVVDNNGKKQYVAQKSNFIVEFPITKEIAAEALRETNKEYRLTNFLCYSHIDYGIYKDLEDLEKSMAQQNCIIVKGVFQPEHGTSVVEYEKRDMNENVNRDYFIDRSYTRYNFKVEKIYTPCEEFNVGEIIPIVIGGTIVQQQDGTYLATGGVEMIKYRDFSKRSLEERTFILSLDDYNYDKRGGYSYGGIFLNAYEDVQDGTGDKDKQIAYDILQKYN